MPERLNACMPLRRLTHLCLLLAGVLCLPAGAVTLQEALQARSPNQGVYDFAGVLSEADARRLNEKLKELEAAQVAEGAVVLAPTVQGGTPKELATGLLEGWGVGDRARNNGFVLLVSFSPRRVELDTGYGLEGVLPDAAAARILQRDVVPALRSGRYAEGLLAAVSSVEQAVRQAGGVEAGPVERAPEPPAGLLWLSVLLGGITALLAFRAWPRGTLPGQDRLRLAGILLGYGSAACAVLAASQAPAGGQFTALVGFPAGAYALTRSVERLWIPVPLDRVPWLTGRFSLFYWGAAGLAMAVWLFTAVSAWMIPALALVVAFGTALPGYVRRSPRQCPECGGALRWLPEDEEPKFLRDDERIEQELGGVDYDIWRCRKCERNAVMGHTRIFAGVENCPRCGRRTLTRRTVVEANPTLWQDGIASEVVECHNPVCGYNDRHQHRLERRRRHYDDGAGGVIIIPPIFGGGWGGGHHGDSGGWGGGGIDVGDFGGGGGGAGGAGSDW
jgi:uncharacterized protein